MVCRLCAGSTRARGRWEEMGENARRFVNNGTQVCVVPQCRLFGYGTCGLGCLVEGPHQVASVRRIAFAI